MIIIKENSVGFRMLSPLPEGREIRKDPMSHRIIEKRRRDRMNNCLADLSRLVPTNYLKKGRGRIEKTEIIEMAIKHLKHLQAHPCKDPNNCEVAKTTEQDHKRQYRQGYHECMSETVRFMVESEGLFSGDAVCVRLINHLQKHYDKVAGGMCYTQALGMMVSEDSKSMNSNMEVDNHSNSCYPVSELYPTTPIPASQNFEAAKGLEINPAQESESPARVTSQLREMLQNPGVPSQETKNTPSSVPVMVVMQPNGNVKQQEDGCYKFKNTIKHRFNADLRHYTSSPTDSHHSLQEVDDHNNNKILRPHDCSTGHAFSPYTTHTSLHPDSHHPHWDSHAETTSSCGSNPSPPPKCSNGSSSGYSTNGENKSVVSPYPRTPDRLSNRSPSPLHPPQTGVPIFALHPKGSYYIPLTIELSLLIPYLVGLDDIAPVLHPISICVNLSSHSMKVEKPSGNFYQKPPSSYLMEKFHDRYIYPCPQSPTINNSA